MFYMIVLRFVHVVASLCWVGGSFIKIWAYLEPGGRAVLVNHFSPEENVLPDSRLEWSFLDSLEDSNFSIPTIDQIRAQLSQAGFAPIPGETILTDCRTVLQAQKVME